MHNSITCHVLKCPCVVHEMKSCRQPIFTPRSVYLEKVGCVDDGCVGKSSASHAMYCVGNHCVCNGWVGKGCPSKDCVKLPLNPESISAKPSPMSHSHSLPYLERTYTKTLPKTPVLCDFLTICIPPFATDVSSSGIHAVAIIVPAASSVR